MDEETREKVEELVADAYKLGYKACEEGLTEEEVTEEIEELF